MKTLKISAFAAFTLLFATAVAACSDNSKDPDAPQSPSVTATPDTVPAMAPETVAPYVPLVSEPGSFAKGADVGWLSELEAKGEKFYDEAGREIELMKLLRDEVCITAIRLRVWVNPPEGWSSVDDVVMLARRARSLGLRLMIDFHFSDSWADPGKQYIPAAWQGHTLAQLKEDMKAHVTETLSLLKQYDIEPEWVQVGNETTDGMLWDIGKLSNGRNFTELVNAGYDAVKAVFPDALVIVHCDRGDDTWRYNNLFGKLEAEGGRYDMIGMSFYPDASNWENAVNALLSNISYVQSKYGKPVMICEIGFDVSKPSMAEQMLMKTLAGALERDVKGIFWWEPESTMENTGYGLGAFQNGRPTQALNPFKTR